MNDLVIFYFRKQTLFFYSGMFFLTTIYSYFLSFYFIDLSDFSKNIFMLLFIFALIWIISFTIHFSKHKQSYRYEYEEEKYNLMRHKVTQKYNLSIKDNIFSKVDLIVSFMEEKFSAKSLLSIKILKLTNNSLSLYIENLKIKNQLNLALSNSSTDEKKEFYTKEIEKNKEQNKTIELNLDNLIKELMKKNNNDDKISTILNEFEHSTKILTKIKTR